MLSECFAIDLIEELRLRRWARQNYVPQDQRCESWHPVVHNEMDLKDFEELENLVLGSEGRSVVPLCETRLLRVDAAHSVAKPPRAVQSPGEPAEFHYA